jgi:hypothetical protein
LLSAKQAYARELDKIHTTRRLDSLELVGEKVEAYFYAWRKFHSTRCGHVYDQAADPTKFTAKRIELLKKWDQKLSDASADVGFSISRLRLLAANDAANALVELANEITRHRNSVMADHVVPNVESAEREYNETKEQLQNFHELLSKRYLKRS